MPNVALPPAELLGEYRIDRLIGEGGTGTVYAVTHTLIAKKAAMKVVNTGLLSSAEAFQRFIQEARAVNEINHPNIVDIFSYGHLPDGRCYLVMELLQGESLHQRLTRGRPPLFETVEILCQVSLALEAAHKKGIIHRDLKPDNVFLANIDDSQPMVKLLDFGLVKFKETSAPLHQTTTGAVMGTPHYMSPEQARGGDVDTRTDIYSFGVMAFEMILGRVPFDRDNPIDTLHMHLHQPPPSPRSLWPRIPDALERLLLALLAKDAVQRPSLTAARTALLALEPSPAITAEANSAAAPLRRRWTRIALPGAALVLSASVLALVGLRRNAADKATSREEEAIKERIAHRRLIAPPGDSAYDRFLLATRSFPDRPVLRDLIGPLAAALKEAAIAAVREQRFEEAITLIDRRTSLVPPDAEVHIAAEKARIGVFALRSGMLRAGDVWIDRYEYPNIKGARPLTRVDFDAALDLCRRAGKRLCTEEEWELACAGDSGHAYPYGADFDPTACVVRAHAQGPAPAGSRSGCVTDSGVADLSGNVAEWTDSALEGGRPQKIIRGGYWEQPAAQVSCRARDYFLPGQGGARYLGFRCCR
jgi:tRNA A-37 threonylcarbamoyl transferase component Bud32